MAAALFCQALFIALGAEGVLPGQIAVPGANREGGRDRDVRQPKARECALDQLTAGGAAGQALAGVPNIELVTLLVFLSGFLLGVRTGAIVGAVAMGAHSLFNVMGAVVAPMLAVQVLVYAGVGAAGAVIGPAVMRMRSPALQSVVAAVAGAACAFCYQLLINVTAYFTFTATSSCNQ